MSEYSPRATLKGARNAAWLYTPKPLEHWREDIASDVVMCIVEARVSRGVSTNAQHFKWAVQHAVRRLMYLLRGQSLCELAERDAVLEPSELGPIALWRLQGVWPELTDAEQLALFVMVADESPVAMARAHGLSRSAMHRARRLALARLDNPGLTAKGRNQRQRVDLRKPEPIDPAVIAAQKEFARVKAKARRDRQKARKLGSAS